MPLPDKDVAVINQALQVWRQGDISLDADLEFLHLADMSRPHSRASIQAAKVITDKGEVVEAGPAPVLVRVEGLAMLSQTCDIVRCCRARPFIELAPLVRVEKLLVEEARRLKRPSLAYVPAVAARQLVAHLDCTMTVEKAVVAGWRHVRGCETDDERRHFAEALVRKRARFAFPDDFGGAARRLVKRLAANHSKQTDEGRCLRALREIRVHATPSWDASEIQLDWWFIKEDDPGDVSANWPECLDRWLDLFDQTRRFRLNPPVACRLEDMTARDYIGSDRLDLDRLSVS